MAYNEWTFIDQAVADAWSGFLARGARKTDMYDRPGALAVDLDPRTVQTPALDLIDAALVDVAEGRCDRLIISMPPQEGKSERVSRRTTTWLLTRNPELRILIASYEYGMARRWGRAVRNDITTWGDKLGLVVSPDSAAAHDWHLAGHQGGVYCVGIGGALTGRPGDVLIIDDPIKDRRQAESEAWRDTTWDWWRNVARTRLAPGAAVVLILTRWHEDDLAGRLLREDDSNWRVIRIPAQADHRPERGESDPIGRAPGEWMQSSRGRDEAEWQRIQREVGVYVFTALYQGRPSPPSGSVLQREWWQYYEAPQWVIQDNGACMGLGFDEVIESWDMAFKDLSDSDYVVGQVWGRRGVQAFLLDQVRARLSFVESCIKLRTLSARWPQATAKYVEDKANGPAVINALSRIVPGIIPVEPDGNKLARARAVSPFVQARNVWLPAPEIAPWVDELIEECASFPNGVNDDQVDALSQGLNRLLLSPIMTGDLVFEDAEHDEYAISQY